MSEIVIIRGTRYVIEDCGVCGVAYTVPEVLYEHHRQEGGYHHCPNGHGWGWSKERCEREKLRRECDRLKQQTARLEDTIADRDRAIATKDREIKRIKKRSAAGTCPCCRRTFQNMAQHMKRQHPDYASDTGANVVPIKVGQS